MKTDFYTKAILTLIALFLGVLAFDKVYETAIPEAQAKTGKWECSSSTQPASVKNWANDSGWSFMTMAVKFDERVVFCGRP